MVRKFDYKTDIRPDGDRTYWVSAEPNFSEKETFAKGGKLAVEIIKECKNVMVSYGQQAEFALIRAPKKDIPGKIGFSAGRVFEVVVPPQCARKTLQTMKKLWGGKWKYSGSGYSK